MTTEFPEESDDEEVVYNPLANTAWEQVQNEAEQDNEREKKRRSQKRGLFIGKFKACLKDNPALETRLDQSTNIMIEELREEYPKHTKCLNTYVYDPIALCSGALENAIMAYEAQNPEVKKVFTDELHEDARKETFQQWLQDDAFLSLIEEKTRDRALGKIDDEMSKGGHRLL